MLLGNLPLNPVHDAVVNIREVRVVLDPGRVKRLLPNRARHLDESMLIVKAPVHRITTKCEHLPNGFGLRVSLITNVAFGSWSLCMRTKLYLCVSSPACHYLISLVSVRTFASVTSQDCGLFAWLAHILWLGPGSRVFFLEPFPFLFGHSRRFCCRNPAPVYSGDFGLPCDFADLHWPLGFLDDPGSLRRLLCIQTHRLFPGFWQYPAASQA
mmetsp:Transcript_2064/g.4059  ORF Transcript_2064/g.4059 Transcript_2064/m.4059 type:complete len:212 (-) Transcript_2064:23-658(-)